MLIPSSNTSIEREYPAWMPRSLSFHFARLTMTRLDAEGMAEQQADLRRAVASLADARVDAVLLCQTAASYWMGRDWDAAIRTEMTAWCGAPALTAAQTVLDALAALGATRVGFAAPFPAEIGQASLGAADARRQHALPGGGRGDRGAGRQADGVHEPGGDVEPAGPVRAAGPDRGRGAAAAGTPGEGVTAPPPAPPPPAPTCRDTAGHRRGPIADHPRLMLALRPAGQ
jgi:hypothetical protein